MLTMEEYLLLTTGSDEYLRSNFHLLPMPLRKANDTYLMFFLLGESTAPPLPAKLDMKEIL